MMDIVDKKKIAGWTTLGFFFINIVGSLLHFAFQWTGSWRPTALIAAVNESTWEHLKLAFWTAFVFSLLEYRHLYKKAHNYVIGKTTSLYLIPISITIFFYGYLWVLGHDSLFLDIAIFVVAVGIGQIVSYCTMVAGRFGFRVNLVALIMLIIITAAFCLFTYFPPHMFLFKDPITGGYGIINR